MADRLNQSFRLPDSRCLTYAEFGPQEGKPVFYFHGLAGSRLEPGILNQAEIEKAGLRLIAPDRPGMGGSDFQPGRDFSHYPVDILALADYLELRKFAVMGVSGGSGYVAACARFIPERLTAAVILSGAGEMNSPEARASFPFANRLMWWVAARSVRLMGLFLNSMPSRSDPEKIRAGMLKNMPAEDRAFFARPGSLEAFIASGLESMRQGVQGVAWDSHLYAIPWDFRLEEICFPVHLLHGEADRNVPVAVARRVAAAIPGCQATFYPGEIHIPLIGNHLEEVFKILNCSPFSIPRE